MVSRQNTDHQKQDQIHVASSTLQHLSVKQTCGKLFKTKEKEKKLIQKQNKNHKTKNSRTSRRHCFFY